VCHNEECDFELFVMKMGMSPYCKSKIFNESKALILQSLRDIITQEEWEKERSKRTNTNCITIKDPLMIVQKKLKEQLLEEKWTTAKKICAAKINLKKAKKRREETGYKLNTICKKFDRQCKCLERVSKQHQLIVSSHTKIKGAFNDQQCMYDQAIQKKSLFFGKIEKTGIEMNRLNKVLAQMYNQWSRQVVFRKKKSNLLTNRTNQLKELLASKIPTNAYNYIV